MFSSSQQGNTKLALGLSKLYEREFNQPDLHDKVLVFDVVASNRHDLSKENVGENKSNGNKIIENEEGENQWERASRNGKVNNEGINTDDENETKVYNCEMSSKYANGGQRVEKRLNNLGEDEHVGTETNAIKDTLIDEDKMKCVEVNEAEETAAASKHEITVNENVRVSPHANNRNKLKDQLESEISNDDNDPNLHLSDGETSEKLLNHSGVSSGKNYKITSFSTSEGQIIEQHKFYVHSSWLALQSSYFRSLFFPERSTHRCTEVHVKIPRNEAKAHFMLLEAMYKIHSLDNASVDDLLIVLQLAHEYNVEFVFQKCVYSLQSAVVSLEICKKIMCFIEVENAITYADDLVITLQSFLEKEFSPLDEKWPTKSFEDLSETLLRYLLSSDKLVVISENTVFHALMHWIEKRGIEKLSESRELPSLLSVVRFETMTVDYLYDIVQHNPIAKTLPDFHELYLRGISYHALSGTTRQRSLPQPVTRRENPSSIVYTWNIPGDQLDLLVGNDKSFKSDEFWVCGYKMVLVIEDVSQVENYAMFHAKLSLEVLNLTDQSEMTIKWKPICKTSSISTFFWEIFTFKKESRVSSVYMRYITATTLPPLSSPTKNVFTGAASVTSRPPPQSRDGINLGFPTTNVFNGAASTTKPLFVFPADTSQSRSGMNPTFPTKNVSTRAASTTKPLRAFSTATRSLLSRSRSESNPTFPTANVSTGAASITKPAFVFSTTTPPSQSRSQTYHNLPTANVPTGAASPTKTSLLFSTATLPSQSRSETYPNLPTANVPTCAASTTKPAFVFSTATLPSQSRSQSNPTFPMTNVSTGAASTTKSSFLFSTSTPFSQSRSETNPNPNLPTANVSTCAASTTKPSFGLSTATLTSQSRNGVNPTFPTTNVSTGAASTTKPSAFGLSTATLPSQSRNGVNPTFPTTNVSTCAAATTKPSFVFSTATLTSQSRNGVNPTFLTTNVSTGAASTTKPSFGLSTATIPSQSRSEVNPAFPTINVSTGAASITKPSFVLSTATISSRSRSGINPTFLTTNVFTGATTSKTPVFAFSADTFSSQSRGGMNYGLPTTNVSTIASASSNQNANPSSSVSKPASGEIGKVLTGISFSIYAKVK